MQSEAHRSLQAVSLYSDSPWASGKVVATTQFVLPTSWSEIRLNTSAFRSPAPGQPIDFTRTRALAWIIEHNANDLWLDDLRVVIPSDQYRNVMLDRLRGRQECLLRDLRVLRGRGYPIGGLEASLSALDAALDSVKDDTALRRAEKRLVLLEGALDVANVLLVVRHRLRHYRDKLEALKPHANVAPVLERLAHAEEALQRARWQLADGEIETSRRAARALERETDSLYAETRRLSAKHVSVLRVKVQGDQWLRPNERPIVPFAPHSLYTIYRNQVGWRQPREADYRLLAQFGFNATRLEVKYCHLEPTQGRFDPDYLRQCHNVIDWCDKYGLYVIVDLHWPYPDWFYQGPPGFRNRNREEQNPYQNPEPLVDTFRRLAREFARHPNVLA